MAMGRGFFVETFGCAANKADTESMVGLLEEAGFRLMDLEGADYMLINTCGVKQATEDRIIHRLRQLSSLNKKLIVAGCLPGMNSKRVKDAAPNFSAILDPRSIHRIVDVMKRVEEEQGIAAFSDEPPIKPSLPKHVFNPTIGIIPIAEGCSMACTYCCTRFARGAIYSYPSDEIVREALRLITSGCREVWITSQDNSAYNFRGVRLPSLLGEICEIKKSFFVRVGMMNPLHVKAILRDLVSSYLSDKMFKFLHLPLQSGSDRVLGLMRRGYPARDVLEIVRAFYEDLPFMTLSTDIIVGFPTEDEANFEDTITMLYEMKPDIVNVSKFCKRPGTEASKFEQLPRSVVDGRSRRLARIVREIAHEKNQRWLGWEGPCLIDEKGSKRGTWIGRNFAYKPIAIRSDDDLLGKFVCVKIVEAQSTHLVGRLI